MKNYFLNLNFFLINIVCFICFFCNVNLLSVNINYSLADNYDDFYEYHLRGRTNKADKLLIDNDVTRNSKTVDKVMQILRVFPGINAFANPITYFVLTGMLNSSMKMSDVGNISVATAILGTFSDILNIDQDNSNKSVVLQTVFGSNLYCRYQRVYQEEKDYITKSAPIDKGGLEYSIFPIYPLNIAVDESTGQCELSNSASEFETFFLKGKTEITGTENILNSYTTKCSFSYSATSQQCVEDLDLPIYTEYKIQQGIIEGICFASGFESIANKAYNKGFKRAEGKAIKEMLKEFGEDAPKELKEAVTSGDTKKAIEMMAKEQLKREGKEVSSDVLKKRAEEITSDVEKKAKKAGEAAKKASMISQATDEVVEVTGSAVSYFLDARFVFDPINFLGVLSLENLFEFFESVTSDLLSTIIFSGGIAALGEIIPCIIARGTGLVTLQTIAQSTVAIATRLNYDKAKKALPKYKFCGYDWLSYAKTEDGKYWVRGLYDHSYYKKISDCINTTTCSIPNENVCTGGTNFCKENNILINAKSKNIKNKLFREYTYGGKEYISGFQEYYLDGEGDNRLMAASDYLKNYCIDPRTSEAKGFPGIEQRYYMKGNEKANFACNRFFYDGKSGCLLSADQVKEEDRKKLKVVTASGSNYFKDKLDELIHEENRLSLLDSVSLEETLKEIREKIDNLKNELNKLTYYEIPNSNVEMIQTYSKECEKVFLEARKCCKYRSKNFICLENTATKNNTFCFSNVVKNYSGEDMEVKGMIDFINKVDKGLDNFKEVCQLDGISFEATKKKNTDYVCVFSYGLCPYDFKLNAGLNYKASYCDGNYFTDYQDPDTVLQRGASHLNVDDCRKGLFGAKYREEYKSNFSSGGDLYAAFVYDKVREDRENFNENDFDTIYNFKIVDDALKRYKDGVLNEKDKNILKNALHCDLSKGYNNCYSILYNIKNVGYAFDKGLAIDKNAHFTYNIPIELLSYIKSSAYGKVKNFCQYRAHCVKVEREDSYEPVFVDKSLFLDNSCGRASINSRNILQNNNGGVPRQLSAPIVECIFESLKNLINGVAGNSLCESNLILNNEGYCGSDTKDVIAKKMNSGIDAKNYFESRYQKLDGQFIIKGYNLPISYNPFLKLQKYFINIIKAALTLFLVVYFYKQLLTGKIGDFTKTENMAKLVLNTFKFAIIIWLIFYAGWQQGIYNRIVNFSVGVYSFVNNLFVKSVSNPKNQLLNLDGGFHIVLNKEAVITTDYKEEEVNEDGKVYLCYKYDIFNNIDYSLVNETTKGCERGYRKKNSNVILIKKNENPTTQPEEDLIISNNQEISRLIYFVDKYNEKANQKILIEGLENIWNKYYDGCYFDPTEYEENKSYLAIFDMLDCKFIKYLGYSTQSMVPNLIFLSLIGLVPGYFLKDTVLAKIFSGLGSALFGAMMTFLFIIFNLLIKIIYIFLSSFFTLSLLIFISPIILPLVFYERTKKMVDTWLENIVDMIFKPALNLAMVIVYINLLDMILLKGITFTKHSSKGRGPNVVCNDEVFSFMCFLNSPDPIFTKIKLINDFGFVPVLIDLVIVVLLFVLSDSILEQIEDVTKQLFTFTSDPIKSPSLSNSNAMGEGNSIIDSTKSAMSVGKSINSLRENYMNKIPGAIASRVVEGADNIVAKHNAEGSSKKRGSVYKGVIGASKLITNIRNKAEFVDENIKNRTEKHVSNTKDFFKTQAKKTNNLFDRVGNKINLALTDKFSENYDKQIKELEERRSIGDSTEETNRRIKELTNKKAKLENIKKTLVQKENERKAEEKGDLFFDYSSKLRKSFDEMMEDYQNRINKESEEKKNPSAESVENPNSHSAKNNDSSSDDENKKDKKAPVKNPDDKKEKGEYLNSKPQKKVSNSSDDHDSESGSSKKEN